MNTNPRARLMRVYLVLLPFTLVVGWAAAGVQTYRKAELEEQVTRLKVSQTKWRMRAGRAYTSLLRAEGGGDAGVIRLPEGAMMDCVDTPGGGKRCDPTTIFPPDD